VLSGKVQLKLFALLGIACVLSASDPSVEKARKLYNVTEFEQSLKILQSLPVKNAEVCDLIGRNFYMQGDFKKATENLEKAFAANPADSNSALWLARAYGRRAETSSPFTAPGFASKARTFFEKSVQLDARNLDALNDLFEYYLEAPGFLGGGLDKAQSLVPRISQINEGEGYWAQAKLAEKRKQFSTAEDHLRRAIQAAPHQVGRFIDLARFLAKQGRYQEAEESFALAEKVAPDSPKLMYAKADLYIKSGRNVQRARDLLKRYMNCKLTPDDPPRSEAAKLLKQAQGS
jgi:tetratricopeptide (TPR) repeat protein